MKEFSKSDAFISLKLCENCKKNKKMGLAERCESCRAKENEQIRKRASYYVSVGRCPSCGSDAVIHQSCEKCWFSGISRNNLGTKKLWKELKQILIDQNYKCYYTGNTLIPGLNASVDYIIPISKGGKRELSNIRWIDIRVNYLKRDLTHDEFVSFCNLISDKFPADPKPEFSIVLMSKK